MFNKKDKKPSVTKKDGNEASKSLEVSGTTEVSYITILNAEKNITHAIGNKLTIGSEVGDLLVQLEGIDPRHCTILKNDNVYCFIDHGSVGGTFLNGKRLEAGKTFFYKDGDSLKLGPNICKIENKLMPGGEALPKEDPVLKAEPVPVENTEIRNFKELNILLKESSDEDEARAKEIAQEQAPDELENIDVEDVELDEAILSILKPKSRAQKLGAGNKILKNRKKSHSEKIPTANALLRLFSLMIETIIGLIVMNIFYVFVDFKNFVDGVPSILLSFVKPFYESLFKSSVEQFVDTIPLLKLVVNEITLNPHFGKVISFIFLVFILRLVSTMFLGVSIGQKIIGLNSSDTTVIGRLKGLVRELIGLVLLPFVIFDIPSLFGKRTLKEIITGAKIDSKSNFVSLMLGVTLTGLTTIILFLSPLMKGLEVLSPVEVETVSNKGKPWSYERLAYSYALKLKYETAGSVITLPSFQIQIKDNKRLLNTGIVFLDTDSGKSIDIKKVKEFSMNSVLKDYIDLNYMSRFFEPELYGNIRDIAKESGNFKKTKISSGIANEINRIYTGAFSLNFKSYTTHVIESGPMISGHRDFREKIEGLIQLPFSKVSLTSFGGIPGASFYHEMGDGDEYSFIPTYLTKSIVYKMSEDITSNKTRKLIHSITPTLDGAKISRDFIDKFVSGFKSDIGFEDINLSQRVYERYFMLGKLFLENDNDIGKNVLEQNIDKLLQVLKENKKKNIKLFLNLNEMFQALRGRDFQYFQVEKVRSV